jgi:LDH2 family malate/lactate/ureidoglycolate dehydrogenase
MDRSDRRSASETAALTQPRRATAASVRAQIEAVLRAWGMSEENIAVTAEAMVETDLMGVDSHGISMLLLYDIMHKAGQLRLNARPKIIRESASTALLDGGAGLGHPVSVMASDLAGEKALAHDVGVVSVFNSHHHGALGYYARRIAAQGLIGIVSTTSRMLTVVPTFGAERVLGTNPFCFAAPAGRHDAMVLDMSTSVVAANKVKVYAFSGRALPEGWVLDADGSPLTEAMQAYRNLFEGGGGGLTPIGGAGMLLGGHKGYGMALFAQILAGALGGGSFSPVRNRTQKPSDPDNIGHVFMALNPAAFRDPDDFRRDVDELIDTMRATKPADPAQPVLVPGDPERAARDDRLRHGIPVPPALAEKVREIAASAGAPYLLDA